MRRLDDLEAICAGSELDVAEDDIRCVRAGPTDERDSVLGGSGRPYEANGDIAWLPAIDGGLECDGNGGMVVHEGEADRFEHAAIIAARGRAPIAGLHAALAAPPARGVAQFVAEARPA